MGRIGIVGGISRLTCSLDGGPAFLVMLRQTISCALCRRCFQIIQITVLFLIVGKSFPHVVQHLLCKGLRLLMCHISPKPVGIQAHLVHSDETDGGKMIIEGA